MSYTLVFMKRIAFVCIMLVVAQKISAQSSYGSLSKSKANTNDQKAIDIISVLPEVRSEEQEFFKKTKRHILLKLENDPRKDGYYTVGVIQDMADHYFHLWYFNIDYKMKHVSFWDIPSDTYIPYAKWHKSMQHMN